MTQPLSLPDLAVLTLRDPQAAAQIVLGWKLPREALWTAIFLVGVIVTILFSLGNIVMPLPAPPSSGPGA